MTTKEFLDGCLVSLGIAGGASVVRAIFVPQEGSTWDKINNFYFNTADIENNYISSDSDVKLIAGSHTPTKFKNMNFINSILTTSNELFSGDNENTSFKKTLISSNTINITVGKPTFKNNVFENCEISGNVFYQHGLIFENNVFKNTLIDQNTGVSFFGFSFKNNNFNYLNFTFNTVHNSGFDGYVYIHDNTSYGSFSSPATINLNDFYTDVVNTGIYIVGNTLKNDSTIKLNVLAVNGDTIFYNTIENTGSINSNTSINKSGGSVNIRYNNVYYNSHIDSNEECFIVNNEVHYNINFNTSAVIYNNTVKGNINSNQGVITISDNNIDGLSFINNNIDTFPGITINNNSLHGGGFVLNCIDANVSNSVITNNAGISSSSGVFNNNSITNGTSISGGAEYTMLNCTLVCSTTINTPGTYINQFYNNAII